MGDGAKSEQFFLALLEDPYSLGAEAFRTLRTNLQFSSVDQPYKKLLITSAGPGEGKTTVIANLGVALAQAGKKTLLFDTDLRRPALYKVFGIDEAVGLTSLLTGEEVVGQAIQATTQPNLFLLPTGPLPSNPSELLGSQKMKELIMSLERSFDILLFDSPPVTLAADASVLATLVDGVLLVIKAGTQPAQVLRRVREQLEAVKAHLIGAILNAVDFKRDGYYYGYSYKYYHRYGYRSGEDREEEE